MIVVDAADNRPLASILGLSAKPEAMEMFQLPVGDGPPVRVLVAPEDPLAMAQKPPPDDADAVLILATLDAAFGAEHIDSVGNGRRHDPLPAKGNHSTRMDVTREMLREAGISLRSVILLDS